MNASRRAEMHRRIDEAIRRETAAALGRNRDLDRLFPEPPRRRDR